MLNSRGPVDQKWSAEAKLYVKNVPIHHTLWLTHDNIINLILPETLTFIFSFVYENVCFNYIQYNGFLKETTKGCIINRVDRKLRTLLPLLTAKSLFMFGVLRVYVIFLSDIYFKASL